MKTLKYIDDNLLLNKDVQVIGHQANCQNTFGSGIAAAIREMYPQAYHADTVCAGVKRNLLGNFSVADIPKATAQKHGTQISRIYNLYGQNLGTQFRKNGGRMTDYEGLYSALEGMVKSLTMNDFENIPVVGFPFLMGSALGGGNWNIVSRLIEVAFDGYEGEVLIVRLK